MTREETPTLRVLIVDDERLIRWSLAEALAGRQVAVTESANAREALNALAAADPPPDVVVLDLGLSDSNDLGLLALTRHAAPNARVILMTALETPNTVEEALKLGAQTVVAKPFDLTAMADLVVGSHRPAG
jgi:DNA-binding NtrC family response regulator